MEIKGQVAVVTGGASGLGQACVQALLTQGAKVVSWDKQPSASSSPEMLALSCQVTEEESVNRALNQTIEQVGVPRILIQCAGVLGAGRMVSKTGPMSLDEFRKVIEVNLIGSFNVMRLVSWAMMDLPLIEGGEERGAIINTASIAAFEGQIGQVAYSASKGGVVSMTLPLARELAKSAIRVNTIAPGLMETPMLLGMDAAIQERLVQTCVFPGRLGKPSEFAALVCHVLQNSLMNGEVLRLDGAIRLQPR